MKCLGIDLSLTSPALCLYQGSGDFNYNQCTFYYLTSLGKAVIDSSVFKGTAYPQYSCDMERYNNISAWVLDIVKKHKVDNVYIEDYAYGAVGRVFNIAENTGVLKHMLWLEDVKVTCVPPTVIKKFATGKGNANKQAMQEAFIAETGTDIKDLLKLTVNQWNPSSDIIDSYYICKYGAIE